MKETIKDWLSIILEGGLILFGFLNLKPIIKGLKGSDNKWEMNEVAKLVVLGLIIYVFVENGTRDHEWLVFSDATVGILLAGLFALADIKEIIKYITDKKNGTDRETDS